jgi:hypothetical protein
MSYDTVHKFHILKLGTVAFSATLSSILVSFVDVNQYKQKIHSDR